MSGARKKTNKVSGFAEQLSQIENHFIAQQIADGLTTSATAISLRISLAICSSRSLVTDLIVQSVICSSRALAIESMVQLVMLSPRACTGYKANDKDNNVKLI